MKKWFSKKTESEKKPDKGEKHIGKKLPQETSATSKSQDTHSMETAETDKLEANFETLRKAILADTNYWTQIIKPVSDLINKNPEYIARFGSSPSFDKTSE